MINAQTKIDTRDFDDFIKTFKKLTPFYTDKWSIDNNDFGSALSNSFFYILESVIKRLNKIPEKNFIEFLNLYGIKLVSAQSASAPVIFALSDRVTNDVLVNKETQLLSMDDDGNEVIFRTDNDLLVSRAKLFKIFVFEKDNDHIFDRSTLSNPNVSTPSDQINMQKHELYFGHSDLLNMKKYFGLSVEFFVASTQVKTLSDLLTNFTDWAICNLDKKTKSEKNIPMQKTVSVNSDSVSVELSAIDEFDSVEELEINSVLSRWIKCTLADSNPILSPKIQINFVKLELKSSIPDKKPDKLYSNDLNFPDKINFHPLGKKPVTNNVFYIADADILSKKGHNIQIRLFHKDEQSLLLSDFNDRVVSWEYWNGRNWTEIPEISISQDRKNRNIVIVHFLCPADIAHTAVNGYDSYWVRSRLASGDYGREQFTVKKIKNDEWITQHDTTAISPPFLEKIFISFDTSHDYSLPDYCVTRNNLIYKNQIIHGKLSPFTLFSSLEEYSDNLYLGFDEKLFKGPLQIFFNISKNISRDSFNDKSKFYYLDNMGVWKILDVDDGTNSFLKSGIVRFQLPSNFDRSVLFNSDLYWLKIENSKSALDQITGIFHNAVICHNSQAKNEIVGSSDNLPGQEFKIDHTPIFKSDFKLWINEKGFLSDDDATIFKKTKKLHEVKNEHSKTIEQWVLWDEVPRLDASDAFDRHFVVDRVSKLIIFGDGSHGKIPPPGNENIRINYVFGGGKNGNLPKNSISELKTAVPFVEKVTNPLPSEGGLDVESVERATLRGPHSIKNRGRAITREDYEWLVLENFPSVAKVRCLSASKYGEQERGGHVTIVAVPSSNEKKPVPTQTLLDNIFDHLQKINSNVIQDVNFSVMPPIFSKVSISVDLHPKSIALYHKAESSALFKLKQFLHPLHGGKDGLGWEFGIIPCASEIYELLNKIPEIDHLDNLSIKISVEDPQTPYDFIVGEGDSSVPPHSLIYGAHHEINPLSLEVHL